MTVVIRLTILGEPASKANGRRHVTIKGFSRSIKSAKALAYAASVSKQLVTLPALLTGDLALTIRIYYASRRPDLDESLILDLLQGRVYGNDRQVRERHVFWGLDKSNPRAEIEIRPMLAVPQGADPGIEGRPASRDDARRLERRQVGPVSSLP